MHTVHPSPAAVPEPRHPVPAWTVAQWAQIWAAADAERARRCRA